MEKFYHVSNKLNKEVGDIFITESPVNDIIRSIQELSIKNNDLKEIIDAVLNGDNDYLQNVSFEKFYDNTNWENVTYPTNNEWNDIRYESVKDEIFLEFMRLKSFQDAASRLLCIYLHNNDADIQEWWNQGGLETRCDESGIGTYVYTVIPTETRYQLKTYEAHRNVDDDYIVGRNLEGIIFNDANCTQIKKHSIMNYWSGAELKGHLSRRLPEVLFIGTLKIIEKKILSDVIVFNKRRYGIDETDETLLSLYPQDDE